MKVTVVLQVEYEVEVETESFEFALRAITANWDTYYKMRARWPKGVPPVLDGRLIEVKP